MKTNLQNAPKIKAVAYCRMSSDNQRDESIDAQKAVIQKYADANGIVVLEYYCDYAKTATTTVGRKEFLRMIDDSCEKKFSMVLVYQIDRFARDEDDHITYRVILKRNGVKVVSVTERFDETPEGKLMEAMVQAITAYQSRDTARKVKRGMKFNADNGVFNGSKAPFGYKLVKRVDEFGNEIWNKRKTKILHTVAIDDDNAEAVKLIFNRLLEKKTLPEINHELNAKGFRTTFGNQFRPGSLENILRNEKYTGVYTYNLGKKGISSKGKKMRVKNDNEEEIVRLPDKYPQIISVAIDDYLLSGKIFCGECGGTYRGGRKERKTKGGFYHFYKCKTKRSDENGTMLLDKCGNCTISADVIEKFVVEKIRSTVLNVANTANVINTYNDFVKHTTANNDDIIEKLNRQIAEVESNIKLGARKMITQTNESIVELIQQQIESFISEKNTLLARLGEEQKQKAEIIVNQSALEIALEKLRGLVDNGDTDCERKLVEQFCNKVLVYHDRVEVLLNILPKTLNGGKDIHIDRELLQEWQNQTESIEKEPGNGSFSLSDTQNSCPARVLGCSNTMTSQLSKSHVKQGDSDNFGTEKANKSWLVKILGSPGWI